MSEEQDFFLLRNFYFDRIWLKAYPAFFSNLRVKENFDTYREYRRDRVFEEMTESAFCLYRTLDCIRRARARGIDLERLDPDMCGDIRRYGEKNFYAFSVEDSTVEVITSSGKYAFTLDQIDSLKLLTYTAIVRDRPVYMKAIYMRVSPYLSISIKPYLEGFVPPLLRVFYNPLIRAKQEMGIDSGGYVYQHENFIDPYATDFPKFRELNHRLAFDRSLIDFVNSEWEKWFGRREKLRIKVTQVELAFDSTFSKMDIVNAFKFIGGKTKTLKSSVSEGVESEYTWTDIGIKYYVTVKRGFQVKTYTKAYSQERVLNRIEFTFSVGEDLQFLESRNIFVREDLIEVFRILAKTLKSEGNIENIIEILRPFAHCKENCDLHYAFLFDLFVTGQIKGSDAYRELARIYKRYGLIKVRGRGRNSVYVLNEDLKPFAEKLRKVLGLIFEEYALPRTPADNPQTQ